jgi:hypothetical protein
MAGPSAQTAPPAPTSGRRDRIFISYRRADSAGHAGRLKDDLSRLLGDRVFMDVSDIGPGANFEEVLGTELASCGVVLAIIGPRWLAAFDAPREGVDYVRVELTQTLARGDIPVVPVLVQGASLPTSEELPSDLQALSKRQATTIRDDRWKDDVVHLAQELRGVLKLSRLPVRWVVAGVVALAALASWFALNMQSAPAAFGRSGAHETVSAAITRAAKACKPANAEPGQCPMVFQFAPDGTTRNVYFASGDCRQKAPPFGDCVLQKLAAVRIPPFNNVDVAEVSVMLTVATGGAVKVEVEF